MQQRPYNGDRVFPSAGARPWDKARAKAAEAFFKYVIDNSTADAYTGRVN